MRLLRFFDSLCSPLQGCLWHSVSLRSAAALLSALPPSSVQPFSVSAFASRPNILIPSFGIVRTSPDWFSTFLVAAHASRRVAPFGLRILWAACGRLCPLLPRLPFGCLPGCAPAPDSRICPQGDALARWSSRSTFPTHDSAIARVFSVLAFQFFPLTCPATHSEMRRALGPLRWRPSEKRRVFPEVW